MSGLTNVRGVVVALLNKFVSPFIENLNPSDLDLGIMSGDLTLHNLKLKSSAIEKYNLPVDVVEGHVGLLHVTIPWFSFRSSPITITIEDVFLLAKVKNESDAHVDPVEEEKRAQDAKQEKLRNAESLDLAAQTSKNAAQGQSEEERQTWLGAFTSKLVDNVQIKLKNVHLRYEDDLSTPNHPFAAGVTLSSFKAVSTDENWVEAFIQSGLEGVRKLATLDGLSIYFDTDATSIHRSDKREMFSAFLKQIASKDNIVHHQYILKPVSGEARTILRKKPSAEKPKTDTQVFFDEIGFVLDDDQYRDALSMLDLFHFYTRTRQYRKYRPAEIEFKSARAKSLWKFATTSIRAEIHEKHRQWTWDHFRERRDVRRSYVEIYAKKLPGDRALDPQDQAVLEKLELELSYEDIRFFRSVARAQARKDAEVRRRLQEEKAKQEPQQSSGGWFGWVWGGTAKTDEHAEDGPVITDEDRKQLNEIIDYDASAATGVEIPRDFRLLHVEATLKKGTLALRKQAHASSKDIILLEFQTLAADVTQYPKTLDATMTLGSFSVFDGTAPNSLHPQIVRVKDDAANDVSDPFFTARFERNPLDERADTGLTVKMRHLEIFYHRGYVESIFAFFRPPASQLESINALLDAAGETFEGIRNSTRASLEYALDQHKTIDLQVDMNAPIIIIPEE